MGVAAKLYRLLQHAAREYTRAHIPLVGIVGFESTPNLVVRSQLASLFREPVLPGEAGHYTGEAFRALRQIQHQLEVLRGSEEDTRDVSALFSAAHARTLRQPGALARGDLLAVLRHLHVTTAMDRQQCQTAVGNAAMHHLVLFLKLSPLR